MINFLLSTAQDPRVAFQIGGLTVQWYGLLIVCGMLLGLLYACWQAKKIGLSSDDAVELFLWLIPLAIVFARLLYVIPRADEYFGNNGLEGWDKFVNIIAIWKGGITIIGGLLGGLLGAVFFSLRHKKETNFLNVVDLVVVPVLIGQIVGRWGNFVNQEAFGLPITNEALQFFPFGVYITDPSGVEDAFKSVVYSHIQAGGGGNWFCATFFYESVWNTIGAIFCVLMWKKDYQKKYPGILMIFYLFWYCIGRFWLEYLRMDAVPVTKTACLIVAILSLVIGVLYILARTSRLAYLDVRKSAQKGINGAILTQYEVKNYKFVGKLFEDVATDSQKSSDKAKKFFAELLLKIGYVRKSEPDYIPVDFENADYYHVPKDYKRRFNAMKKQDVYAL